MYDYLILFVGIIFLYMGTHMLYLFDIMFPGHFIPSFSNKIDR